MCNSQNIRLVKGLDNDDVTNISDATQNHLIRLTLKWMKVTATLNQSKYNNRIMDKTFVLVMIKMDTFDIFSNSYKHYW